MNGYEGIRRDDCYGQVHFYASLPELEKLGWERVTQGLEPQSWYPSAGNVVVRKGDAGLQYVYSVGEDDSDYAADKCQVQWSPVRFVKIESLRVEVISAKDFGP